MLVDWNVPVRMSDGVVLRADVFRRDASGRYPVILAYGPYGKGLDFDEGFPGRWKLLVQEHPEVAQGSSCRYANFENADPEKWVPDGYVCVRVDSRGIGRSEGYLCLFQPRETRDYYECIEWAGTQPWSNGKVGLSGISYLAMNQWQHVASLRPPHLAAMIPWEGAADWYRDSTHHGGIRTTFWDLLYDVLICRVQHGVGKRGFRHKVTGETVAGPETLSDEVLRRNRCDIAEEIRSHPFDGPYYRERSPDWSKIEVPFLSAGNWGGQGLHLRGNVEGFVRAASRQKWLEVHGLEHWTHYYTDYGLTLQKQFFGHFLKGDDNGWEKRGPVLLNIRHVDRFVQREEREWPLARTQWTRLYLDAKSKGLQKHSNEPSSISYDGFGSGVTFSTAPFERETEITGPAAACLYVSSSTADADLFLVLRLFDPRGEEVVFSGAQHPRTPLSQGWLRASHRRLDPALSTEYRPYRTHERPEPLVPGEMYALDIEIWPTCIVIPPGYRLALTVRGTDYDYGETAQSAANLMVRSASREQKRSPGAFMHDDPRDRPPELFGGRVSLHTGAAHPSSVLLPFIPVD